MSLIGSAIKAFASTLQAVANASVSSVRIIYRSAIRAITSIIVGCKFVFRQVMSAASISWRFVKSVQRMMAALFNIAIGASLVLSTIISPVVVAFSPLDNPFLMGYEGYLAYLPVAKVILFLFCTLLSFHMLKSLTSGETIDGENSSPSVTELMIRFVSGTVSWSIIVAFIGFLVLSRAEMIGVSPWTVQSLLDQITNVASTDSSEDPFEEVVPAPPEGLSEDVIQDSGSLEVAAFETLLSRFSSPKTYSWRGIPRQGLLMNAVLKVERTASNGLKIQVTAFSAEYLPDAVFNPIQQQDRFSASLYFTARQNCEQCRPIFTEEIPTNMRFKNGNFRSLVGEVQIEVPLDILLRADEIKLSLLSSDGILFLFPESIELLSQPNR